MLKLKVYNKTIKKKYKNVEMDINNNINPMFEYIRFILIQKFKNNFIPHKKYPKIDIHNIFPRWLMNNPNNSNKEPVLPINIPNNKQFIDDIIYNYPDISKNEIDDIINYFDLTNICNNIWNQCKLFVKNYKNNYIITSSIKDYFSILSITINIDKKNDFIDIPKIHNIKIPTILYNKIINKLKNNNNLKFINDFIYCLFVRYETLQSNNQQLANNPDFYLSLKKKFGVNFELFASGLNCLFDNYCSLYPDLEKIIGSNGTFDKFDFDNNHTFYVCNPPFDEEIVLRMVKKLFKVLQYKEENNKSLSIFITIPSDWTNFVGLELIKKSHFLTYFKIITKNKAKYFNYTTNKFIYPCNVAFILLQNIYGINNVKINIFDEIVNKFY